jgi:hypothetical protein
MRQQDSRHLLNEDQLAAAVGIVNRMPWRPTRQPAEEKPVFDRAARLQDVAAELGVTGERVRQIEAQALTKCRRWCLEHGLALEDLLR